MNLLEKITDQIAYKFSGANRQLKFGMFLEILDPQKNTTVLDIGFDDNEYSATDNYLEKHYPWPENITALSDQKPVNFTKRYPKVRALSYDGINFPFKDSKFDIAWSNAVIEHVGNYDRQSHFLKEIKRTCKKGYITTPNRWFPIEVHTRLPLLHYLPKKYFDYLLRLFGMEWAAGDYVYLLSLNKIKKLLREADIKAYKIYKNRLFGFTLDFVIVF